MTYGSRRRERGDAIPLRLERTRVLLSEDNGALRELIARALRDDGYDVIEVCDSAQAPASLRPHLIVSDLQMAGVSGSGQPFDLIGLRRTIRALRGPKTWLPVLEHELAGE